VLAIVCPWKNEEKDEPNELKRQKNFLRDEIQQRGLSYP
jgi:hypothetical protein